MNTNPKIENNTLGEYKLSKIIGEGTFGKVQLGIHIPTGEKVAIKILQKQKIVDQSDIERVTREICILKILRHPNIVHLYEIIETQESIHLVMEYIDGGELFDHIVKKRRLPQKEAVKYFQQLLSGVQYLHKNGIVHRDLKPENLLFDGKGCIKIVDFGLSNQYKSGEKLKTACGSPCYAAPEMIAGKSYECSGVDIWSCGIILFAMLCGYLPFEDENTNRLYKKILCGDLHLPKHLSGDSKELLNKILNVNPETRYSISQIRSTAWYNQIKSNYQALGIIVGKDHIEINDEVVNKMQVLGYQTTNIKAYLANNKHNYLTALYYLLKIKLQRLSSLSTADKNKPKSNNKIENSRAFSPNKRNFYIPPSSAQNSDKTNRDQSLNATKIISSLVEANKNKLRTPFAKPVIRRYENKPFPREIKNLESSLVYRQNQCNSPRLKSSEKNTSLDSKFSKTFNFSNKYSPPKTSQKRYVNVGRQETVSKLREFSNQIHRQIRAKTGSQLISQALFPKSQVSFPNKTIQQNGPNIVHTQTSEHYSFKKTPLPLQTSQAIPIRKRINSDVKKIHPYIHSGPFNSNCLFMEHPGSLLLKIIKILRKLNIVCKQNDHLTLSLENGEEISIQSFQGIIGYYLVKFTNNSQLCEQIISHLKQ